MDSKKYTDEEIQQQLGLLDEVAPLGWDMDHSWEKLERMREAKKTRLWGYLEKVAAVILLLAIFYGYFRQESVNGEQDIAETLIRDEDSEQEKQFSEQESITLEEIADNDLSVPISVNSAPSTPKVLEQEEHYTLAEVAQQLGKESIDSVYKQLVLAEPMNADTAGFIDTSPLADQIQSEANQSIDSLQIHKKNQRPPIIHFSRPQPPSSKFNRKFEVRLKKLDRMITAKPNRKKNKYQYVGKINFRKP